MRRSSLLVAGFAVAALVGVGASAAADRPPITQAASGKTIRLAKGETATLRLSNRWHWSEPRWNANVVDLTPVEYFVNPGFREWTISTVSSGRATIRSVGRPSGKAAASCSFTLTVVVG